MLPAISADLPVYVVPPATRESGRTSSASNSGDATLDRAEFSDAADTHRAIEGNSRDPNTGLYGPDGRFVGTTSHADMQQKPGDADDDGGSSNRDLTLAEFNAAVPPAAREELKALADRVEEKSTTRHYTPNDYRRMSQLMSRVGRYLQARDAELKAKELETQRSDPVEPSS